MRSTTKTRVQRRLEKKQAVLLVALVLAVSVVSFVLGVVVGRHSGEATVTLQASEPQRIIVDDNLVVPAAPAPATDEPADEKLTFYENLSKDEISPIGSGINMPPNVADPKIEAVARRPESAAVPGVLKPSAMSPPASVPVPVAITVSTPALANTLEPESLPAIAKGGEWVVQVFSSRSAADAGLLRDKLGGKGYPAFITEADLGPKGIWYRVLFGPYADKAAALQTQTYAGKKDKLTGFVKHR